MISFGTRSMIMISGRLMMLKAFVATLLILVCSFLPAGAPAAEPAQKGRIGYPVSAFSPALLILVLHLLPAGAPAAEPVQKVRIGYPSSAVSTLPFDIAKEKRRYAKAGLDVEYIQMRTAIAPQAILNGNINFFTSPQSG